MTYRKEKIKKTLNNIHQRDLPEDIKNSGEMVYIHLTKYYVNGKAKFKITKITDEKEDLKGNSSEYQVIITGELEERRRNNRFRVVDISKEEESKIVKDKEGIKNKFVQMFRVCFPTKYMQNGTVIRIDGTSFRKETELKPIKEEDFKVTTVWKNRKCMHVGNASVGQNHHYKIGVNWRYWNKPPISEERVKTITHEMVHCDHLHHKKSFYLEHARAIRNICSSEKKKKFVEENIIGEEVDWDIVKTLTLKGPHNQSDDISTSGFQNRREACEAVISEMEEILDYKYLDGQRLYLNPLYLKGNITPEWGNNSEKPSEVGRIDLEKVEYSSNYTDRELNNKMEENLREKLDVGYRWGYSKDTIPIIDEDGKVVENGWFVEMVQRMMKYKRKKNEDTDRNINIPVIRLDK